MGHATPRPLQRKCYTKNWGDHECDIGKIFAYWHLIATSLCVDVELLHVGSRVSGTLEGTNGLHNSVREGEQCLNDRRINILSLRDLI